MLIDTQRLTIRELRPEDAAVFGEMAVDGSLQDVGFDQNCRSWMADWINEAMTFAARDNPAMDYLAYAVALRDTGTVIGSVGCSYYEDLRETGITYFIGALYRNHGYAAEAAEAYAKHFLQRYPARRLIATAREENTPSWKALEKAGFRLTEKKPYQDINDKQQELYRFYEKTK